MLRKALRKSAKVCRTEWKSNKEMRAVIDANDIEKLNNYLKKVLQ